MTDPQTKRHFLGLALFAAATLALLAAVSGNPYFVFIIGITLIHVFWASGMNLLYGYTGLMPMMFGGIAGISAYATVYLMHSMSFWLAAPLGILLAALVGIVLGMPALRLRGFYFALCSLVIQQVISLAFVYFSAFTNGDTGISQIPAPPWFGGTELRGNAYAYMLAAAAILGIGVIIAIVGSRLGRRLIAIREDDGLAETLGINITLYKLLAFFIGPLFAGIGGALYAPYVAFISPRSFDVLVSLNIWLMVAFGGGGMIWGPVLGAALLAPLPYLMQDYYTLKEIIYGLLIVAVIILLPGGLLRGLLGFTRGQAAGSAPAAQSAARRG